jgi:hypothetical protein
MERAAALLPLRACAVLRHGQLIHPAEKRFKTDFVDV